MATTKLSSFNTEVDNDYFESLYKALNPRLSKPMSYTRLDCLRSCPKKYKFIYLDKQYEPPSEAMLLGKAVHSALEAWVAVEGEDVDDLLDMLEASCEKQRDEGEITEQEESLARAMLIDYYEILSKLDRDLVVGVEQDFELVRAGAIIRGIIDRASYSDSTKEILVISDYKGLALDTPIPTPTGWTTIQDITVGDLIFGGDGRPCQVTAKSKVHNNPCYKITFDDNTSIVADHEHLWKVSTDYGEKLFRTEQLAENLCNNNTRQRHLRIDNTALLTEEVDLPIDPYVLGTWIGDGHNSNGEICKPLPLLFDEIESRDYLVGKDTNKSGNRTVTRTVFGLRTQLRSLGLLRNKHIPVEYLRASYQQRLDLLRGIMDTDGYWNPIRKRCVLNTTNKSYADQINELVVSLGWKATTFYCKSTGFGKEIDTWQLWFTPVDEEVFLARLPETYRSAPGIKSRRRLIMSVIPINTVPTQCLVVSSPDHTFLCGEQMVRTHNTGRYSIKQSEAKNNLQTAIYTMAAQELWPAKRYITELVYPRLMKTVRYEFSKEELEEKENEIRDLVVFSKLSNRFPPKGNPPACGNCGYRYMCNWGKVQGRIWDGIKRKRELKGR